MKTKTKFFVLLFVTILPLVACFPQAATPQVTDEHSVNITDNRLKLLWSINNVYAAQNDYDNMLAADSGVVCVLGDIEYPMQKELSCFDGFNGTMLWQKGLSLTTGILMDENGIYVGYGGIAGVEKFDLMGKIIWSTSTLKSTVKYKYLYKNQIQLYILPEKFVVLDKESGEKLDAIDGENIFFSTGNEKFLFSYGIDSWSFDLKQVNWKSDIPSNNIYLAPLFTEKLILLRTGGVSGKLLAMDRKTGQVIWKMEKNIISSIAYFQAKSALFALSDRGELIMVNVNDGTEKVVLSFTPEHFNLNGGTFNVGGYELAFDNKNKTLFILLGDSRQLYAFQME